MLILHENWKKTDLLKNIKRLAEKRNLENLTISPILSMTNE